METNHDPSTIAHLPIEINALILSHLDVPSLRSARFSHSSLNNAFLAFPNHVCRGVCIRSGLADTKTSGAAAALKEGGKWVEKRFTDDLDPEELQRVITAQGTMLSFDAVVSWEEYARARYVADQNWLYGRPTRVSLVRFQDPLQGMGQAQAFQGDEDDWGFFWRFKLDVEARAFVLTGLRGGCLAYTNKGELAWSCQFPITPYPHVELSDGHITLQMNNSFLVLRRSNLPSVAPATDLPRGMSEMFPRMTRTHDGHSLSYDFDYWHTVPAGMRASKLRYPYLLSVNANASLLCRWDVRSRELSIDVFEDFSAPDGLNQGAVMYAELDGRNLILAGEKSIVLWRDVPFVKTPPPQIDHSVQPPRMTESTNPTPPFSSSPYALFPPRAPTSFGLISPFLAEEAHYTDTTREVLWGAAHHDGRDGHLVAISQRGDQGGETAKLVWAVDYQRTVFGEDGENEEEKAERALQKTVVLTTPYADLTQLAVENGRAIFVASTANIGHSLWLINLREFKDLADFASDPPKPICLGPLLPTLLAPSRLEATSTEIFLPSLSLLLPSSPSSSPSSSSEDLEWWFARAEAAVPALENAGSGSSGSKGKKKAPLPFKWQTLDGQTLVDYSTTGDVVDWSGFVPLEEREGGMARPLVEREEHERIFQAAVDGEVDGAREELERRMYVLTGEREEEEGLVRLSELERWEKAWEAFKEFAEGDDVPLSGGTDSLLMVSFAEE
ncbi:hypothetical protein JCM11251_004325 [Rhodosporidiobolus azoricus]